MPVRRPTATNLHCKPTVSRVFILCSTRPKELSILCILFKGLFFVFQGSSNPNWSKLVQFGQHWSNQVKLLMFGTEPSLIRTNPNLAASQVWSNPLPRWSKRQKRGLVMLRPLLTSPLDGPSFGELLRNGHKSANSKHFDMTNILQHYSLSGRRRR